MDNSPNAAEIIAEHERDVARLRRVSRIAGRITEVVFAVVIVYAVGLVLVGLFS